jgi:hypothetical protein
MHAETLGRYRIKRELGRGSMGRVFLAHDPEIDRQVAVKSIHVFAGLPEHERSAARERFIREVRAAGRLLHPGIVAIFDVGEEDGVPYLAMEYVEGETLDAFCAPATLLPVETVVELIVGSAETLDYAHREGIVHRDIKPANILRVGETGTKIMDFGLAKGPHASLTQDGGLLGTPSYMSPEQIHGSKVDGRSDLFSLAIVLYEMLTGVKPFAGETVSSVLYRIVNEQPSDATTVGQPAPEPLARFLKRALTKRPENRFQSGLEFAAALSQAASTLGGEAAPSRASTPDVAQRAAVKESGLPPPPRRRARKSRLPGVVAGAAIVLLTAAAVVQFREPLLDVVERFRAPEGPIMLDASVRTEPPGLPVLLDGAPLEAGAVRFPAAGGAVLSTTYACRAIEHALVAEDAGTEVVLIGAPVEVEVEVDPGIPDANVRFNDADAGSSPTRFVLDLCRDNEVEVTAKGFYPASVELPAGATPVEARAAIAGLTLERIPVGRLVLPATATPVVFYVDGERTDGSGDPIELVAGEHVVRAVNKPYWIDVTKRVEVLPGEDVTPALSLPALGLLTVQAFPSNCKVYLRRSARGRWSFLDATPLQKKIASGSYELRIEFVPTGETREQTVEVTPSGRDPVRFSFASSRP